MRVRGGVGGQHGGDVGGMWPQCDWSWRALAYFTDHHASLTTDRLERGLWGRGEDASVPVDKVLFPVGQLSVEPLHGATALTDLLRFVECWMKFSAMTESLKLTFFLLGEWIIPRSVCVWNSLVCVHIIVTAKGLGVQGFCNTTWHIWCGMEENQHPPDQKTLRCRLIVFVPLVQNSPDVTLDVVSFSWIITTRHNMSSFQASLHQTKMLGFYCDRRNPQTICITPLYSIDYINNMMPHDHIAWVWLKSVAPINPVLKFLLQLSAHH